MADQYNVGDYPHPNTDAHLELEQEKAAKMVWVGVANSTEHTLTINWSVTGARRTAVPKKLFKFGLELPVPVLGDINPQLEHESGETPLVLTGDSSTGTRSHAQKGYDKVLGNADTDENSKLVHLDFYKDGETKCFWQTAVAKGHGVIVIEDPDDPTKLSVIPAAGQSLDSRRWKPHKNLKNPKKKITYVPKV